MAVKTRPERANDHAAIAAVVEAAFGSPVEARLVEALRGSAAFIAGLSLVAEDGDGGQIVGHVMITWATLDRPDEATNVASLAPLAVAPARQGEGIGSALMRAAIAGAEERGEAVVVLQGDPRYYGRFGFVAASAYGIEMDLPSWAPPEAAQVLPLRPEDLPGAGRIVYPAAFDVVPPE